MAEAQTNQRPYIVALGGTLRANSSTEKALKLVLDAAEALGAETCFLRGADLDLPIYAPERTERTQAAARLVTELRRADGIVIGSPGYHGGISGLVKNALDYTEDMRADPHPYFDGRAVGCVATGAGWQGATATLTALRAVVHALRGWPAPIGIAINTIEPVFDAEGQCLSAQTAEQLKLLAKQIVGFARWHDKQLHLG